MPKYIRTKDGIYEVEKLNLNKIVGNIKYEIIDNKLFKTMYGYEAHLYKYEILKQSDTIAELCDEFVEVYKVLKNKIFDKTYFDIVSEQVKNGSPVGNLYGAIWTDKGLIYVAKMNEDGELVLI